MSVPEVTRTPTKVKFYWHEEQLHVVVDRIHEHRDRRVTCELTLRTEAPGYEPHLLQASHNLSSLKARTDLARLMSGRYSEADWDEVLEQISVMTLEALRTGEPVQPAGVGTELREPSYLLYPLLPKGLPTLLYGEGASAKSYLALHLALSVQVPIEDFDWHPIKSNVLYLDYETDFEEVDYRLKKIKNAHGIDTSVSIMYRRQSLPLWDDADKIIEAIDQDDIGLVIVDSLGAACGGDLKEQEVATRFFGAIRRLPVTSLTISHVAKNPLEKTKTPFGSIYFYNFARNVIEVKKIQETGEDEISVGLFHRKCNLGKLHHPMGFRIEFGPETTTFTRQDIRDIPEFSKSLSVAQRIEIFLRAGPMDLENIAEELDIHKDTARITLGRMEKREKVVKRGDLWGLRADE